MFKTIATKLARQFKRVGIAGHFRFWCLYWAYRLTGWHIRHKEWSFVLEYLPKLHNCFQKIDVLDVGCCRTLFCHELAHRGYKVVGIDLEDFPEFFPGMFLKMDICEYYHRDRFDFITCISVLEHIGDDGRGDIKKQELALENMCKSLRVGGRLILTCPSREFAVGHPWHGFTWNIMEQMLQNNMVIVERTERAGQLCLVAERTV